MTDLATRARVMTPGTYLSKRRLAAELTVNDVALLVADNGREVAELVELIGEVETDAPLPPIALLDFVDRLALARPFSFDKTVLLALIGLAADDNPELPHPQLCRDCACSWNDACFDDLRGACSWAGRELCSHCAPGAAS